MPQPSVNPFHPAEQVVPKVKCLIYGVAGVGKTYWSLTAPGRIAMIDTEGGTAFYARRAGQPPLSHFDVLPTKTYRDVQSAVDYLAANPTAYATLVIDPLTVIYETLQDAALVKRAAVNARKGRGGDPDDTDLEMLDWGRIKRAYKALMTQLVNLPLHVIVTAREKADQERQGTELVTVGWKADAEKGTTYFFDVVLRMVPTATGREVIVLKDRTGTHPLNARLADPTFGTLFDATLAAGKGATAARSIPADAAAAETDAQTTLSEWTKARLVAEAEARAIPVATIAAIAGQLFPGVRSAQMTSAQWTAIAEHLELTQQPEATEEPPAGEGAA